MVECQCNGGKTMNRRVVITGMGAVTPIGNDVESFWNNSKSRKTWNRFYKIN